MTPRSLPVLLVLAGTLSLANCGSSGSSGPSSVTNPPTISCPSDTTVQSADDNPTTVVYNAPGVSEGQQPVTTNCSPASGTLFPLGQTAVTCVATDSRQRTASCGFTVKVQSAPRLSVTKFLAFGDSMTYGEDGNSALLGPASLSLDQQLRPLVQVGYSQRYPEVVRQLLALRYTKQIPGVDNQGKRAEALLGSGTYVRFASWTASGNYDAALILEGANDLVNKDAVLEPGMIGVLRQMIANARSHGMKVWVATLPPEVPSGYRAQGAELVAGYNSQLAAMAASENVPLVDLYTALSDTGTCIGIDGLHPTVAGYAKMADAFYASIKANGEVAATSAARPVPLRR